MNRDLDQVDPDVAAYGDDLSDYLSECESLHMRPVSALRGRVVA